MSNYRCVGHRARVRAGLRVSARLLPTDFCIPAPDVPGRVGRGVHVLCHIRMKSHAAEAVEAFEAFVASRDEIVECYSMSGDWDYLLLVLVADVEDYNHFLMRTVLRHPSVSTGSSHFALARVKYTTAVPI